MNQTRRRGPCLQLQSARGPWFGIDPPAPARSTPPHSEIQPTYGALGIPFFQLVLDGLMPQKLTQAGIAQSLALDGIRMRIAGSLQSLAVALQGDDSTIKFSLRMNSECSPKCACV